MIYGYMIIIIYCLGQVFIDNVPHLKILMQRKDDGELSISYFEMTKR